MLEITGFEMVEHDARDGINEGHAYAQITDIPVEHIVPPAKSFCLHDYFSSMK